MNEDYIKKEFDVEETELESYELLQEDEQEFIDIAFDGLMELDCDHCIRNLLADIYLQAFKDGENFALISVSNSLRGIVEDNI